jgi:hypothetical protein
LLGILGKMLFENRRQLRILKVDVIGTGGRGNYGGCYRNRETRKLWWMLHEQGDEKMMVGFTGTGGRENWGGCYKNRETRKLWWMLLVQNLDIFST